MPTTNARVRKALEEYRIVRVVDEDPAEPEDGAVWYNATEGEHRAAQDGAIVTLDATAVE